MPLMDSAEAQRAALAKRRELQEAARAIGVNEEYISRLVDEFYSRVLADPELGPVFNGRLQDRWPDHLAKMKRFWGSVALRTSLYEGRPMQTHLGLTEAAPRHFEIWIGLFEQTLRDTAPNEDVVAYFMQFARMMSARFQSAMFGKTADAEL